MHLGRRPFLDYSLASGPLADGLHLRVLVQGLLGLKGRRLQVEDATPESSVSRPQIRRREDSRFMQLSELLQLS